MSTASAASPLAVVYRAKMAEGVWAVRCSVQPKMPRSKGCADLLGAAEIALPASQYI